MGVRSERSFRHGWGASTWQGGARGPAANGHICRFTYPAPLRDRGADLHARRDADAFVELAPLLFDGTRTYGGTVFNWAAADNHEPSVVIPVREDFLTTSDLLVLTTRPPLDDSDEDRKRIARSFTSLEHKVFNALRHHFVKCSRSFVQLSPCLRGAFPAELANRAHVEYRVHGRFASYKGRRDHRQRRWDEGDPYRTGAYLIYKRPAWPAGPELLVAFAMNGIQTLLWAHFLGSRPEFSTVLARPRFLMAEIELQDIPHRPENLEFADGWKVETLLDYPLG